MTLHLVSLESLRAARWMLWLLDGGLRMDQRAALYCQSRLHDGARQPLTSPLVPGLNGM